MKSSLKAKALREETNATNVVLAVTITALAEMIAEAVLAEKVRAMAIRALAVTTENLQREAEDKLC